MQRLEVCCHGNRPALSLVVYHRHLRLNMRYFILGPTFVFVDMCLPRAAHCVVSEGGKMPAIDLTLCPYLNMSVEMG